MEELTREIYWNVGHVVLIPMYLLAFAAIGVMGWGFWKRIQVFRQGDSRDRFDRPVERLFHTLKEAISQRKVLRVPGPGTAHGLFFWGFLLLFIGTLLVMFQADLTDPLFDWRFLTGYFYLIFSVVLDVAGMVAIVMLIGLAARRYIKRPEGLPNDWDHALMHVLLLVILVTGFIIEGARMAVTEVGINARLAAWSPGGLITAKALLGLGLEEGFLRGLHKGTWWFHLFLTIGFIVAIPFTKFRHIFTTSTNYFFFDRRPKGAITSLDLEDEEAESFGVGELNQFSWKDIYDSDACTYCKRCQDRCPAWATDKPLSPMKVINQMQHLAFGKTEEGLIDTVTKDVLWACTTCRACQEICPASIEHVNKILNMRRNLVLMEGEFPGDEVMAAVDQTEVNGNPLGMAFAARADWAKDLGIKSMEEDPEVDVLYFVGCYASFDRRNIRVARAFVQLCQAAGLKVGILGKEEKCCGEPVRKLGNEYLYQTVAMENIELMKGYDVKQVVTTCPHCFNTLGRDYRDLGFEVPVEHYTTFLNRLHKEGKLPLQPDSFEFTYHDSCYIGRYADIFEEPRELLQAVGGQIKEMDKSHMESFCCGAGGGRILAEEKIGTRISDTRAKMAGETGAPILASNCPFCLTMFEDGVKGADLEGKLAPRDIAEILLERLSKQG